MRAFCVVVSFLLSAASVCALDLGTHISQYGHTAWRLKDGAIAGTPNAITQTPDGYLWIATDVGVLRFDGIRFVTWRPPGGEPLTNVFSLLPAGDSGLWIGMARHVARWQNDSMFQYPKPAGRILRILQDAAGDVWIVRSRVPDSAGPLCRLTGPDPKCYGAAEGIPFTYATALTMDREKNLWVGSSGGICRFRSGPANCFMKPELLKAEALPGVQAIAVEPDGDVWVAIARTGPHLGLQRLIHGEWRDYYVAGLDGTRIRGTALFIDRDGSLWIGTAGDGLYRVHDGKADHFGSTDGLTGDSVVSLFEDHEGNLWVATGDGIDCFRNNRVISFTTREVKTQNVPSSVLALRDGSLLVGNNGALDTLKDGRWTALQSTEGLPGQRVTSLFEDRTGLTWVGLDNDLTVRRESLFKRILRDHSAALGTIVGIAEDARGDVWTLTAPGKDRKPHLLRFRDQTISEDVAVSATTLVADIQSGVWFSATDSGVTHLVDGKTRTYRFPVGLDDVSPGKLFADTDGSVWVPTNRGLFRWREGWRKLDSRSGLPCDETNSVIKDDQGALWIFAQCGVIAITASELHDWLLNSADAVPLRVFDVLDGAQPGARSPFSPVVTKSTDGRLWFVNGSYLQMIDPAHLALNTKLPPVHIEEVIADRKPYRATRNLQLPALTRDIEINYTALSFTAPQKVQFRYKLEGRDREWHGPETRRQAFYNDLPPGDYQFRVIASNNDGVWNESGAVLNFGVAPAYYQTRWFYAICALTVAGLIWVVYQMRIRSVTSRIQERLEERVNERVRIARDLHDTLIQSVHGLTLRFRSHVNQLSQHEPARALLEDTINRAEEVIAEGRERVKGLRGEQGTPSELPESFSRFVENLDKEPGASIHIEIQGSPCPLKVVTREELYLLGREAISNAVRHASAAQIHVTLRYEQKELTFRCHDDGRGFDPALLNPNGSVGHWGILGMRERAARVGAKIEIRTVPGKGTEIDVRIPASTAYSEFVTRPRWKGLIRC